MHPDYGDIRSRLGDPIWFDENGVPRYDAFTPQMLGVYDDLAVLMEVECQECGATFMVGQGASRAWCAMNGRTVYLPTAQGAGPWHYGDPPRHGGMGCAAGDTMNSVPRRVLEAWEQVDFIWQRRPDHEVSWDGEEGWNETDPTP